jgi:hypothetical protein
VAACSTTNEDFELSVTSQAQSVPAGRAFVVPPPGGPSVIGVTQVTYVNAVAQTIVLSTRSSYAGSNQFVVRAFRGEPGEGETNTLSDTRLAPERIGEELEKEFPGVDMRVSLAYTQNKYGPFGFAVGSPGAGDLCLYAWQRLERFQRPLLSWEGGAVVIRLRLCESGATVTQLLRTAYGYTLALNSRKVGFNPLEEPPGPPAALGETGVPMYPTTPRGTFDDAFPPAPVVREPTRRVRVRPAAPAVREEPAGAEPLPGYPTVPAPESNSSVQ